MELIIQLTDPWTVLLLAAINPPYRLDPLQNIININWGGGLAVIFGPQASDAVAV